jgi:hypothetical protein
MIATTHTLKNINSVNKAKCYCTVCDVEVKQQVHRPWLLKNVLFFIPIRKYVCIRCLNTYYALK